MAGQSEAFLAHAAQGLTTLCRAWAIVRRDGTVFGFTDHDRDLEFEGITFRADTGLSAAALAQSTGLSVDNTEALGALSDVAVREDEIEAGRFDGADVRAWLVNWADVSVNWLQFRGSIGEIRRSGGAFQAELRGLTEALNKPMGRVYQKASSVPVGSEEGCFDPTTPGFFHEGPPDRVIGGKIFEWDNLGGFDPGWFQRGRLDVLDGPARGLWGIIKWDRFLGGVRRVELWEPIRAEVSAAHPIRMIAGSDRTFDTCRLKFGNALDFDGFPDLPNDDWVMAYPKQSGANNGGSLR
ncbi:MAG: DUF2163 domain-containing protein [Pseudomonadota bacterium]